MNISYNWLKQYLTIDHSPEQLSEILTAIGLEVEGVQKFESIEGGLKGLVAGRVMECQPHPNADKLKLTKVDVGGGTLLSIVCGAPNVDKDQMVVVAPVGCTIYPLIGHPFEIRRAKIRGEVSEGMICAEDEIGLGTSHAGIMVLDPDVEPGKMISDLFQIEIDYVYDIGLTPNRSDATSHLGVAKDLLAYLRVNEVYNHSIAYPEVQQISERFPKNFNVKVIDAQLCPRYAGVIFENIEVKDSPEWLKNRLSSIGVRPLNNVVDITNFVLHEYGQPLHAFDLEAIKGGGIVVRTLDKGTPFISLDEKERVLHEDDLMICDAEMNPLCMAGVFGGLGSGVTKTTKRIFLESAHFHSITIRKTSTRHVLRTDAARIFEKGSDPTIVVEALKRAAFLLEKYANATVASKIYDLYPQPAIPVQIDLNTQRVRKLIGLNISDSEIENILEAMDMKVNVLREGIYKVEVPLNKADVTREADLVEEILRIYGYDRVPFSNHVSIPLISDEFPDSYTLKNRIADFLSGRGMLQMMNLSLVSSDYYPKGRKDLVYIHNTSNESLDIMRPDMIHPALGTIVYNYNRNQKNLKLFEFGRTYVLQGKKIIEREHLAIVLSGLYSEGNWRLAKRKSDYYDLLEIVESTLSNLGIKAYKFIDSGPDDQFEYSVDLVLDQQVLARLGKISPEITHKRDFSEDVFFADLNWTSVEKASKKYVVLTEPVSKFPVVQRDLALVIPEEINFSQLEEIIVKIGGSKIMSVQLFDIYRDKDKLGEGMKSYAVNVVFSDRDKTLKDKEVDKFTSKIVQSLGRELGAKLR
ncbi:MAG: phenylalanine--tRNA ligase subunit beta [Saprospirales bacterium]|nr:MAG: phenylalanine--tRNA ligase subunit beta [Saprospirales bacterium]